MAKRRRQNTGYIYKVRNGQWFVSVKGPTKKKQTEHGPYENKEAAEAFVKEHATARGKEQYVHPSRLPVQYNGAPLSNKIPANATVKVNHTQTSKHGRKNNGGRNVASRVPSKSFDQRWFEGIQRFLYNPAMEAA